MARVLVVALLFQALLPVMAQAANAWRQADPWAYCRMQDTDLAGVSTGSEHAQHTDAQILLCPVCLFSQPGLHGLPPAGGFPQLVRPQLCGWSLHERSREIEDIRSGRATIRAPPAV